MAQVLKPNCSLAGKSLIPIILRVKNADAEAVLELSRLKKDEPLESLTKVELIAQFEKLTGESVKDVLIVLCGKDDNIENVRLLVHESILLANSVGARGQRLSTSNPSTDTPAAKGSDGKAAQGDPSTTNQQLQAMRQDLDELKKNSKVLQVDEALSYVRTLAARPKLTTPGVLLAAIEMLVDAANKANHKDCSLFSKSFSMCKKYEDNVDFCGLVLKLFGSQEDKKISSLISDWAKSKKYEEPSGSKERQDILDAPPTSAPAFPFPGYGYQNPGFGFPYPNFYPGPNYNSGGFRPPRMQGGRGRRVSNGNIRDHEPLAKKEKFEPEIPDWELKSGFDPLSVKLRKQSDILLVNYKGEITQPSDCLPSAEEVVNGSDYDFEDLSFLDPNFFKAGNLMYCSEQWEKIGCPGEILDWIKQGNGVPRVWLPAEQCLVCGYANDVGYQFCQSCGQNPVLIESSERITSNCSVERRLRYLDSLVGSTSYNKKKLSLEKEFEKFLFGGEPVKCLKTASPLDVRRFMVMKDSRGKTQVHDLTCEFLGKLGIHSCQCPLRLAAGTVQSMLGQLKAIFESNGRGSEWNEITKIGNPVCSPEVDKYLHAIQFEQSKSHVVQKQAKPLFLDKLRSISVHIDDLLLDPVLKSSERFIFLRDQAFFKVQYFSGDRANDLGLCISQEVKLLPNGDGFLFSHTVGKTLGKGKVNEFSILRFDDTLICPVKALERYVEGARALGVDLRFGYLFRTLSKNRKDVTDNPVSSNAMYDRLRKYLKKLDIYDGETHHGIRGACAITLALSGGLQVTSCSI
ncbi:Hypothetical predicted protein [Mytilus galloprovincialis]|uniref:ALOG domain-containing protein n=1 Tax=Mytilus galloprovincialis TaxID=29158 RepID=A0A8B6F9D1_MYTGA|nr:Hypothetical predicted protein [Mytilus galloprovincialis]